MDTSSNEEYDAFLEKVKRTIYIDNLSPQATELVIKAAFNQFGSVKSIQYIPNYLESKHMPQTVLVEMQTPKQAKDIVAQMENYPFMISGMPRPVRARAATIEMFEDRPRKPNRNIQCQWLDPKDPDFEVAKKIKDVIIRHDLEASLVLEQQRAQEEKLANQQSETLNANYSKFELLNSVFEDGTAKKLAQYYDISFADA